MKKEKPGKAQHRPFDPVAGYDSMPDWKKSLIAVVFLVLILCILMPGIIFMDRIFLVPDTKAPISFSEVGKKSLESGTYPLWNPYIFCGMPSYQSLSYTPYVYPVSFLTFILQSYLAFPEMTWLLIHYVLAGIGVFLLLRSFRVRASIALLAGAVFMIMPNYLANGANGHGSQACAVAYMPFAVLLCRNIMRSHRRLLNSSLLAVVLGFQMLRGHIQISFYTYLLVGLIFLLEAVWLIRKGKVRESAVDLVFIAASVIVALGIASVLIVPVKAYAEYSIRGGGGGGLDYGYATGWSLHPREMLTFVFPWAFGYGKATYWGSMPFTDYPNYLGIVTALFAFIAMFTVTNRWKWILLVTAVLSTMISFGNFFPALYDLMFRYFPYFNRFRVPVMILIVQQLAMVVLMGLGLEEYARLSEAGELPAILGSKRLKWVLIAVVVVLLLLVAGGDGIRQGIVEDPDVRSRVRSEWILVAASSFSGDLLRTVFFLAATVGALFFAAWKKIRPTVTLLFLAAIVMIDMMLVDHLVLHPESGWNNEGYRIIQPLESKEELKQMNEAAGFLSADSTYFRIFPVPAARPGNWSHNVFPFSDNSYMMSGIFSMGGYHPAKLKNYQDVMDVMFDAFNKRRMPHQILNMLNARYFVSIYPAFGEGEEAAYPLVYSKERLYIYRNPDALGRVFFVDRVKVMPADKALQTLLSGTFDPSREIIADSSPPIPIESAEGSSAEIVSYSLNSIAIKAHVEKSCIMVLSEIDYPDWKATVDGEETDIITADYCLRALALTGGDHEIVFEYSSPVLRWSLTVSVISLLLAVFTAAGSVFIARRGGN